MFGTLSSRWKLHQLIQSWRKFHDMVVQDEGVQGITKEKEEVFLGLKGRIARQLPMLADGLPTAVVAEVQRHQTLMTDLINRHRTLRREAPPSAKERDDFEHAWHSHFIFLNKMKGLPRQKKEKVARARHTSAAPSGMPAKRVDRTRMGAWVFRFLVQLAILILILYLVARTFGMRWDGGRFVTTFPTTLNNVGQNLWEAVRSIWTGFAGWLSPVSATYGTEVTIGLVGILLITLAYWVFIRRS